MNKIIKKPTVTIGIPAFNEARNIGALLKNLINQKQNTWILDKIYVVNDASTDQTPEIVESFKNKHIVLVNSKVRRGKPKQTNQIFDLATSDIVVLLDADIILKRHDTIKNLVLGFRNKEIQLVSGSADPVKPTNFTSNVLYAGVEIWNIARNSVDNSEMYFCEGQIKALKKDLYKKIRFPDKSADDVYPFLYLDDKSKFYYAKKAQMFYKLPLTIKDLFSQQQRYGRSKKIHTKNFGDEIISKYYVIKNSDKLRATLKNLMVNPFWTLIYLFIMFLIQINKSISKFEKNARWEILTSTKV